jgi:hypothetical protein
MRTVYAEHVICLVYRFTCVDNCYYSLLTSYVLYCRVSGQNCANIYNHSFPASTRTQPLAWPHNFTISTEEVWHAFNYNALLRDCAERNVQLVLADIGTQDDRLQFAMEQRNSRILKDGQRERMHACDVCEKFIPGLGYMDLSTCFCVFCTSCIL